MLLPDSEIRRYAEEQNMISPFSFRLIRSLRRNDVDVPVLSFGLSSYGYDIRLARDFKVFSNVRGRLSDPKNLDPAVMEDVRADPYDNTCIIPPNSFALAESMEYMRMPDNVTALTACKSTYIRAGLVIPPTVIEAGWHGTITLELINATPIPLVVYAEEGILQLLFFEGKTPPEITYAGRKGKYHNQRGITLPRV